MDTRMVEVTSDDLNAMREVQELAGQHIFDAGLHEDPEEGPGIMSLGEKLGALIDRIEAALA